MQFSVRLIPLYGLLLVFTHPINAHGKEWLIASGNLEELKTVDIAQKVHAAYRNLGYSIKLVHYPFRRSLSEVERGVVDAELARIKGIEKHYSNLIPVPEPVGTIKLIAISHKPSLTLTKERLKKKRIGFVNGIVVIEKFLADMPNTQTVNNHKSLLKMLELNRIDVGICVKALAEKAIEKYKMPAIKIHEPPLMEVTLYHYLHKRNKHLIPGLNQEFKRLNVHQLSQSASGDKHLNSQ